ncbi:MAG: molybdopterin-guanine dinucleotide biosynthesis protein MobB [Gammaproteobacteria bacterium]|nr:molybdopterin-guanine dinucleotide biosynthesis protein MobB [Gammaproteobacteria bacterium]MCF6231206.1 molybdopterin-guanine dinucleotide biosynthesis protein MobB [Gammaproteobacteria bacterium]
MMTVIDNNRINSAKRAFVTRNVVLDQIRLLDSEPTQINSGDLVLARVEKVGNHKALELTTGRRSILHKGDEVLVAYGNRYAPDQYEAVVPEDMGRCDLVAAGGIASKALSWSTRIRAPTRIRPIGLVCGADGKVINLSRYKVAEQVVSDTPKVIAVVGSSMNAGKTTTVVSLVRGLTQKGYRVGAVKITGTGAGGDLWKMHDAGATEAVDFTDAGISSTFMTPLPQLHEATHRLVSHLAAKQCDVIVMEIADGIYQQESSGLIQSSQMQNLVNGYVYAADGSTGAAAGVAWLQRFGLVLGVSGKVTASPLASREAEQVTGLPCYTSDALAQGEVAEQWLQALETEELCEAL